MDVTTVADARAELSQILRTFRDAPSAQPVVLGAHRKPEAVLVPFAQFRGAQPPLLTALRHRSKLITRLALLNKIAAVSVFGSVARGEETLDSDIDLLVDPLAEASLFDLGQFALDLEQVFDRHVDVVSRRSLIEGADDDILVSAVPL
ncbi:MAG: nucleotidyltransferase domain-containing protein [Actinomycetota bacterium]